MNKDAAGAHDLQRAAPTPRAGELDTDEGTDSDTDYFDSPETPNYDISAKFRGCGERPIERKWKAASINGRGLIPKLTCRYSLLWMWKEGPCQEELLIQLKVPRWI